MRWDAEISGTRPFGEGVDLHEQAAEFHCMLSWGSQTVLGCKENYLSNRILRWLETKLESHWDGDLWMIRVQRKVHPVSGALARSGWAEQSIFKWCYKTPTGPHAFSPSFPFAVCPPFLFPVSSLFLPYFHSVLFYFSLEVSPCEWFGVFYKMIPGGEKKRILSSLSSLICTNQHKVACWSLGFDYPLHCIVGLS